MQLLENFSKYLQKKIISGKNLTAKISPTKKSPMKINNNLKVAASPNKSLKSSPARTPTKSIKPSHKPNVAVDESTPMNAAAPDKNNQIKDASETKSFITFSENLDESHNENIYEKSIVIEGEDEGDNAEMNKLEGIDVVT